MSELTSKKYWEDYYQGSSEDAEIIRKVCGRYDRFYDLMVNACSSPPKSILEIGAFPGRYLAYLSSRYGLTATGLDFNPDSAKFDRSMKALAVDNYDYVCADFLNHIPDRKYDLIFSNGFIEHFTNYEQVLDKHVSYLNDGGSMLILIPNKRYLRKIYGYLLDYKNLKAHNLKCMRLDVFRTFASRNNLKIEYLSYDGGFAHKIHQVPSFFQKPLYKLVRFLSVRMNGLLSRKPSKWYSGTIVAVLSRNA